MIIMLFQTNAFREILLPNADNTDYKIFIDKKDFNIKKSFCKLYYEMNNLYLCDLNSSNYTYLNKKRLTKPEICKSGDIIKVGKTYLKIEF